MAGRFGGVQDNKIAAGGPNGSKGLQNSADQYKDPSIVHPKDRSRGVMLEDGKPAFETDSKGNRIRVRI